MPFGSQDYASLGFEVQETAHPYGGCTLSRDGFVSFYRWHPPDPVYWKRDIRVTIQQRGIENAVLFERQDDWCCSSFWYEPIPSPLLPTYPDVSARLGDIWRDQ